MISAADVLTVATPSWKTKGLRSAKDLLQAALAVVDGVAFLFVGINDSTFVATSLAALLILLRESRREVDEQSQKGDDGVRLDSTRRNSVDIAIMVIVKWYRRGES